MNDSDHESEIDKQLEDLADQAGSLISPAIYRSSFDLYGQLRRKSKQEQRAYFYVLSVFHQMDEAQYLLDFQTMRERAIELISLLESEEQCRKIQADMPPQLYEALVYQMSSCAYENLAEATGQIEGYNSEGMQACIADGLHVCRKTGKLACIGCFREYSCDVYLAADDAEMASHQIGLVLEGSMPLSDRGDRRWLVKKKQAWLSALAGRHEEAIGFCREALDLCDEEEVTLKLESKLRVLYDLDALLISAGQNPVMPDHEVIASHPPEDECPMFDLQRAMNEALQLTMGGDHSGAGKILTGWDKKLQGLGATHLWFELRLRLIANSMLAGDGSLAERLAKQLQKRASTASDWLTLRRLTALQDEDFPTTALAIYGRPGSSKKSGQSANEPVGEASAEEDTARILGAVTRSGGVEGDSASEEAAEIPDTPLAETIAEFGRRLSEVEEDGVLDQLKVLRDEIMAIDQDSLTHREDACGLLFMISFMLGDFEDAAEVWTWANSVVGRFENDSAALSLLGDLGNRIRFGPNESVAATITAERLDPIFRKTLQQEDIGPRTYMRCGDHFMATDNHGEAERCYARGFRLSRSAGDIATRLATLYRETDRPRDALHVLDLCVREGSDDPRVAWEAAMMAFFLDRFEVMLTYLDQFEEENGEEDWIDYYRSIGLLEQGDPRGALDAIRRERERFGSFAFHLDVIRGCTDAALGDTDSAQEHLSRAANTPLYIVDMLSPQGIASLLLRAVAVAEIHCPDLLGTFQKRLIESGSADDDFFLPHREKHEPTQVNYYRCLISQPLDEAWDDFPSRLAHQEGWESYFAEWGVLAEDEEKAEEEVLAVQSLCYPITAELEGMQLVEEGFMDSPGVVWQGPRFSPTELPPSDEDDEMDDDLL